MVQGSQELLRAKKSEDEKKFGFFFVDQASPLIA